uniref:hypothetical protein n=1 Tax=uncultured Algoriphagus sp. TaxID=417365 RepID=UPI00259A08DD
EVDLSRDHLLNDAELEDQKLLKRATIVQVVWPILIEQMSNKATIQAIIDAKIVKGPRMAYSAIQDTVKVYGRIEEADRKGAKAILIEITKEALREARNKARDTGNWAPVERLIDKLAKLQGLYETTDNLVKVYQELRLPDLQVSSDPAVLDGKFIEIDVDE